MVSFFYTVVVYPIRLILECCYTLFSQIFKSSYGTVGFSVIALSFVVTLLTIPLYMVAEKWSQTEQKIQEAMAYWLSRIKIAFKGDERYMIQREYYRLNNYHPIMALRSSFGILIQIPFFIAAYEFLSNLYSLKGVSFLFIKNLGAPDQAFRIGSFAVNILPIIMTLINCISGFVYSKGHPLREKIQIYGCAMLFLVILYNSPSGLVVYWTMNNILSLVKNVFYKLKNPKKVLYIICCVVAVLFVLSIFTVLKRTKTIYKLAILLFALILVLIPYIVKVLEFCIGRRFKILERNAKLRFCLFFLSVIGIALLAGLHIPSMLIQSEPEQFSYLDGYDSPFIFLHAPFVQSLGLFLFWPCCFYALFSTKVKKNMAIIFTFLFLLAVVNCFVFSGNYGPIEPTLFFMQTQFFTTAKITIANIFAIIVLIAISSSLLKFKPNILIVVQISLVIGISVVSVYNCFLINKAFNNMEVPVVKERADPIYHLSRDCNNVIVIMQDALVSSYIDLISEERSDFRERMDGFVYYPNAISMAGRTMFGSPGLFGGYDYTPYYMNLRNNETLQKKHNEALLTMPVIFSEAGWNVTVSDLPYENFLEQPVSQMYNNYPKINHISVRGTVSDVWYERNGFDRSKYVSTACKRNFLMFSIFKMVSPFLRLIIYQRDYWSSNDNSYAESYFIDNYSQLDLLDELVDDSSEVNSFIIIDNETTHTSLFLQAPDYVPSKNVDNYGNSSRAYDPQFHTDASAMLRWTDFFDYLKKENLYDNTRIIIVSDHGAGSSTGVYKQHGKLPFSIQSVASTLLVKDFNCRGTMKTDMTFMTNADTPYLATKDIIEEAKNPFTGNDLKVDNKFERTFVADAPNISTRYRQQKTFVVNNYYKIKDNIFDDDNWIVYDSEGVK